MKVLVECYPDTALVRFLGIPRKQILHERSKGNVINRLRGLPDAVGIVDEDPASGQHRDLANYQVVKAAEGLRLLARRSGHGQKLIVLCPRLEEWLMHRAKVCGLDPKDHRLLGTARELHGIPRYDQKDGYRSFIKELTARDPKGMGLLRRWVHHEQGAA